MTLNKNSKTYINDTLNDTFSYLIYNEKNRKTEFQSECFIVSLMICIFRWSSRSLRVRTWQTLLLLDADGIRGHLQNRLGIIFRFMIQWIFSKSSMTQSEVCILMPYDLIFYPLWTKLCQEACYCCNKYVDYILSYQRILDDIFYLLFEQFLCHSQPYISND